MYKLTTITDKSEIQSALDKADSDYPLEVGVEYSLQILELGYKTEKNLYRNDSIFSVESL